MTLKNSMKGVVKKCMSWHFQISKMKKIFLKRSETNHVLVCGEPYFKTDVGTYKKVFMTSRSNNNIELHDISKANKVTHEKKKDVDTLLEKHFGEEWRNMEALKFYAHVTDGSEDSEVTKMQCCQPQEEEQNLFV